ncbi:hypothetical protein FIA58_020540 [Flavobacterium jejuense]|uniref:DUF4369 domain-containing protein n=1 Tax=Flavobacterium jejuense TaxID=1544455 RepID=A0ABX0IWI7_9FLAO|nr:hypothetical protein [Flavobacterium jejuense]NHN28073.1 hypothetical protein [Flavobacterium jejuense]
MRTLIIYGLFIFFLNGCSSTNINKSIISSSNEKLTSIISIIGNPQSYHGKEIVVQGYFVFKKDENSIYVSKTDYENGLTKNAIFLILNYQMLEKFEIQPPLIGYFEIKGVFDINNNGSYNLFSGTINNISDISRLYKIDSDNDEYNMN